ncbi:MAG: molybdenum cofactor guanylyltransferase [Rhodocyclaceae bacterium]|nr:molybdenum cofactor guanylyltransferase [Rhodocyclaceae bacterium]
MMFDSTPGGIAPVGRRRLRPAVGQSHHVWHLHITGLVLAGGLGRRMGGVDKGLQLLNGRPLIAHVVERLAPQVDTLLVNANRNLDAYAGPRLPGGRRPHRRFRRPAGRYPRGTDGLRNPLLATAPCDAPFLPADLVARLRAALASQPSRIAVARTVDGLQPTFALMRRDVLPDLAACLERGGRRIQDWCHSLPLAIVDFADAAAFANINSPAELASSAHTPTTPNRSATS